MLTKKRKGMALFYSKYGWVMTYLLLLLSACGQNSKQAQQLGAVTVTSDTVHEDMEAIISCPSQMPQRFSTISPDRSRPDSLSSANINTNGMVLIPGGTFMMGADNEQARPDEYPKHKVSLDPFWMDATEVTNAQFREFVEATGYLTTAERKPDWEELKKQLPPGTPRPPEELLLASSLVFTSLDDKVQLNDAGLWWSWVRGADWRHPQGPNSNIEDKDNFPVVHVSWDDALAYAQWAGKRLPTEAEWEWAARGSLENKTYPWGNEHIEAGKAKANSWQGRFPYTNTLKDGYYDAAPVKSFPANGYGLYDMAGNVWEWCADWYRHDYYKSLAGKEEVKNPKGPENSLDPEEPLIPKRVQRGGSFLCHDSYCSSYRVSARMKASQDTGLSHTGFRCVKDVK